MENVESSINNSGALSASQWQIIGIAAFVLAVIALVYFAKLLYKLFKESGKSDYKPNIGLSRVRGEGANGANESSSSSSKTDS